MSDFSYFSQSCYDISDATDCLDLQQRYPQCVGTQTTMRNWLVGSNAFFAAPLLALAYCRYLHGPWMPGDALFFLAFVNLMVVSPLYHECDTKSGNGVVCGQWCFVDEDYMHVADYAAAGWAVHALLLLNWLPTQLYSRIYSLASAYVIPFGAILLSMYMYDYIGFTGLVASVGIAVRLSDGGFVLNRNVPVLVFGSVNAVLYMVAYSYPIGYAGWQHVLSHLLASMTATAGVLVLAVGETGGGGVRRETKTMFERDGLLEEGPTVKAAWQFSDWVRWA
jgi:hypothetical protein